MTSTSLWGKFESAVPERTPTTILREQAKALEKMTKGILSGEVSVVGKGQFFEIELSIVATAINNYRFDVVRVVHDPKLYPLQVRPAWDYYNQAVRTCQNQEEFEEALGSILQSDEVVKVIGALIAQSRADAGVLDYPEMDKK